jgi:TPR repeat protein
MSERTRFPRRLGLPAAVLAFAVWLPATVSAQQNPPDVPDTAVSAQSFDAAITQAQAGDPRAQCEVGVALLNGEHVAQDFKKALAWLTVSSDSGFGYARYVLADVYSRGYAGVPVNDEYAYYYASLAAASSSLPDHFRERAVKLRDASAKRLTVAQVTQVQARAALAPLGPASESEK